MNGPLVTADVLAEELAGPAAPVLLDVRWRLDRPDGRPAYAAGHFPGAVYVDLDRELARHGAPEEGRHPLPAPADLQESARAWGIREGSRVVVYDDLGGLSAARAWWLLRDAGVDVRLLDGGLAAWTGPLETGSVVWSPGDVVLRPGGLRQTDADGAAALAADGRLLDARAGERYRGETEPVDPRAGHIPGALSAPTAANLDAAGRFLSAEDLRSRFVALGLDPTEEVGVYCGSGVTASHEALALELAGFTPVLYPGSWSQWSNLPDRPVETGSPAAG